MPPETPDSLVIRSIGHSDAASFRHLCPRSQRFFGRIVVCQGDGRIGCTFFRLAGIPRIQLQPGASDLLPGLYLFELPVQNPVLRLQARPAMRC